MELITHKELNAQMLDVDDSEYFRLAHRIDGYRMFEQKYPGQSYMRFLEETEEEYEQTGKLNTNDLEDLMILLFLSARRYRHYACPVPYYPVFQNSFVKDLVRKMRVQV
ncbi:MAG: hypothetical protein RI556_13260 [Hydrogenovibrio sp.]|uniref:hypothetical protein n=1 Tax=Hydrogenovibrio sp. TaxID=2065821 RepID=UPI0028703A36|nr:hypothetical protein [Hydrogenovibrio sp.]MDR9500140.1 hypothetical protein [Hydrogenovibrio sp.]